MRTKDEALETRRRKEILEAAARCFIEKGVHQTTIRDVCAAAELSAGALYHYFPSKADIVLALADAEYAELRLLTARLEAAPELLSGVRELICTVIGRVADPSYGRLLLEIASEAARNPAVLARLNEQEEALQQAMRGLIRKGQKSGQLDKNLNPDAVVHIVSALVDGLTFRAAFEPGFNPTKLEKTVWMMLERLLLGDRAGRP